MSHLSVTVLVMNRRWPPLTVALKDQDSPVRRFFDERFPNVRGLQGRYRQEVGPIVVPGSTVNAGTLGGAFDWLIRFLLHPQPDLHLARSGSILTRSHQVVEALEELADLIGVQQHSTTGKPSTTFRGPVPGSGVDRRRLAQGCWALALLTEVFRAGLRPGSPLLPLDPQAVQAGDLLALAPDAAVRQLDHLRVASEDVLLATLSQRRGLWALGPTFDGSILMNADADLIAAGLLLEIKTSLGSKRRDGSRQAALDAQTIQQLVGYCLLDFSDRFEITEIGLYSARYAHLATWELTHFLDELADRQVDLQAERAAFREVLLAGPTSANFRDAYRASHG